MATQKDKLLAHKLRDLITRMNRSLRKQISNPEQLSVAELNVVRLLSAQEQMLPSEFCAQLHLSSQFMSQVLNRLEELDYITRRSSESDKRKILVSLTKNGRQKVNTMRAEREEWLARMISEQFSGQEKETIAKAVDLLSGLSLY
jgi:DNA-binding MarR family transcriptional regulator